MAQMLPVLDDIPEDDKVELRETTAAVEAEVAQPQPNIGKLHELYNALCAGLTKATSTAATDMLIALGHDASKALGRGPWSNCALSFYVRAGLVPSHARLRGSQQRPCARAAVWSASPTRRYG
jgi:hypothetical protein